MSSLRSIPLADGFLVLCQQQHPHSHTVCCALNSKCQQRRRVGRDGALVIVEFNQILSLLEKWTIFEQKANLFPMQAIVSV